MNRKLDTTEYVKECWRKAENYIRNVKSGKIKHNKWIRLAVERYLKDVKREDLEQRIDKVDRVFKFFSLLNININNKYQQFKLLPYQAFFIIALFSPYWKGTEKRKYRYAFLFMARKNGKTVFAASLQLYFLVADGQTDAQSLLLASTREQAQIALDYARGIITNTPVLDKRLEAQRSRIIYKSGKSQSFMKTLASNAARLDGYSPSTSILDEIHAYYDDSLFKVIKTGILARENPMVMLISTAGASLDSFCFDMVENGKRILKGEEEDDSFFFMLYTLDDDDDENNEENWIKSNPALNEIIKIEDLRIEHKQAKNMSTLWPDFVTKNLNKFVDSLTIWIPDKFLLPSFVELNEEELLGKDCYIGLDLSISNDLTALVCLIKNDEDEIFKFKSYFFSSNDPKYKNQHSLINIQNGIKKGEIISSNNDVVDYEQILDKIDELKSKYNIISVGYDRYNAKQFIKKIEERGIDCIPFNQTAKDFNFPLKYAERLFRSNLIQIDKNDTMLWNMHNVVLYTDGNGNIKIEKNKSLDSVDGAVSLGMAIGMWVHQNLDDEAAALDAYLEKVNT